MKELMLPVICVNPASSFVRYERAEVEQSIIDRFEKTIDRHEKQLAVKSRNVETDYAALNAGANRLAHAILSRRSRAQEPFGLLLTEKSQAITAILGVLKAGKFYVPLDPSHPRDRLFTILSDCQIGTIITDSTQREFAMGLAHGQCDVLCADELDDRLSIENPGIKMTADSIAAVFYTSGSTGRPKGVIQSHRNVLHRVMVGANNTGIGSEDRFSLLISPGYSASVRAIFTALLTGASIHPFDLVKEGAAQLADWLSRERLTIYQSIPSVFRQLAGNLTGKEDFSSLRIIDLGGQPVTRSDVEIYKKYFSPNSVLINTLSSNETGPMRQYVVGKSTEITDAILPMGYAIEDKELLLINEADQDAGFNQIGEIAIRSEVLSPGYWRQPELTAAAFQTDPDFPEKKIFRTGDLGLLLPNGCLLYKGRKDFRAKIRGVRVETQEIENALNSHHAVEEAAVVASEVRAGEQALVAYVVAGRQEVLTVTGMREFLLEKLPDYMVPFLFVFLEAFPRTPNGKIDWQALPKPHEVRPQIDAEFVAPQDRLERDLVNMCEVLLGVHPIGMRTNLFDLGADSLTAIRFISQIEKVFHKHIPPATLFHSPTLEQLASILRQGTEPEIWSSLVPLQPTGSRLPFFWIHGDVSNVYLAKYLGPDQPLYGLDHQSQDGRPAVHSEVDTIAAYYLREILTVQQKGPYFIGGYSFGAIVALEVAQQLKRRNEGVGLLTLLDPPNLSKGSAPLRRNAPPLMASIRRHIDKLPSKHRLEYIISRTAARLRNQALYWIAPAGKRLKKITWKICLARGRRIPPFARSAYILNVYGKAGRRYVPQPYDGKALLFKTPSRCYNSKLDWDGILQGGVEVYVLQGDHMELRQESHVDQWAGRLRDSLLQAQVDNSD